MLLKYKGLMQEGFRPFFVKVLLNIRSRLVHNPGYKMPKPLVHVGLGIFLFYHN